MSYDYDLYVGRPFQPDLPGLGSSAHLSCDGPDRLQAEDIAEDVLRLIGKRRLLYRLHLQGSPDAAARSAFEDWLRATLTATRGVLIDRQTDRYETASRTGPLGGPAASREEPRIGAMNFHFADADGFHERGFRRMLATVAQVMPAALPVRYGRYEPLQSKVQEGDLEPLLAVFRDDPDIGLMARAPFADILLSIPCSVQMARRHPDYWRRFGFLLSRVSFCLRPTLFASPALMADLMLLFERLSVELDVIYSDIVTMEDPNGSAWRWRGLPDWPAHARCIGPLYRGLWPDCESQGREIGTGHLLMTTDRFGNAPPLPPEALRKRGKAGYAEVFPFPKLPEGSFDD